MVVKGKLTYFRLCLYSVVSSRCHRCSGVGGTKVTGWRLLSDLGNANKKKKEGNGRRKRERDQVVDRYVYGAIYELKLGRLGRVEGRK